MLQRFASTAFVFGTLLAASIPAIGLAQNHGRSEGRRSAPSRDSARSYGGQRFSGGGRSFVSPRGYEGRRGYYGGGYVTPRSYRRPVYRGFYGGGVYLGYGAPYGYAYDPGYVYPPAYPYAPGYSYGPAPAPQGCTEGAYDQYGNWVPSPNCYSGQPQYSQPPQNYDPNQPQPYNR